MLLSSRTIAGLAGLAGLLAVLGSCRQDQTLVFTKPPPHSTFKIEPKPTTTGIFVSVPLNPQDALAAAEAALPARIAKIGDSIANGACGQRVKDVECVSGRLDGEIVRDGAIELTAQDGRLSLKVPLRYNLTLRGHGWAKAVEETKSQKVVATTRLDAVLLNDYTLEPAAPEGWSWPERHAAFGKGQFDLAKASSASLQTMLAAFAGRFGADMAAQPVSSSVQKAWRTLQQPILITKTPELWISGEPLRASGVGFHQDAKRIAYLVAVGVRASLYEQKPPTPLGRGPTLKRLPQPSRVSPDMLTTQFRLPMLVGLERLQSAAVRSFPAKERLITQADRFADPIEVLMRKAHVYASQRQIALQLDLEIATPKAWAGRKGQLHLLSRPIISASGTSTGDVVVLDGISLPTTTSRDAREAKDTFAPPELRLGLEPFASRFAAGIKIDITQDIANAVVQLNAGLERQVDEQTAMSARFENGQATGVELSDEGLVVLVNVSGRLMLQHDGLQNESATATSAEQIPAHSSPALPTKRPIAIR